MYKNIKILTAIILFSTQLSAQSNFDFLAQWRVVENFEIKALPKSALAEVENIYKAAVKEKNDAQRIKALMYKSKFALMVEEDAQLNVIIQLKQELAKASYPTKNILESVIADLYWQYFQRNRYRFYQRSNTSEKVDSVDFRTWDLQTIFKEAHQHFQNSLSDALLLQKQDLKQFYLLIEPQKNSKVYRPTLYDFLAHRALNFYFNDESNLKRPSYKFEIKNKDLLGTNTQLIRAEFDTRDSLSQRLQALKLYKNLTLFHLKDKDPRALVKLSLERMAFVKEHAVLEDVDQVYRNGLLALSTIYSGQEISGEVDFALASFEVTQAGKYQSGTEEFRWKNKEALSICEKIIETFPASLGAQKCRSLKHQIESPSLQLMTENFIPIDNYANTLVTYKNESQLYFKAFAISERQLKVFQELYKDSAKIAFIKKLKVIQSWDQKLKDERDFQQHTTEVVMPKLPQGRMMIFATNKGDIHEDNTFAYSFVQVTDLVLIENQSNGNYLYQVVKRNNGKPCVGAKVRIRNINTGRYNKAIDETLVTDAMGFISFNVDDRHSNVTSTVTFGKDRAQFGNNYMNKLSKPYLGSSKSANMYLFADRSIYRPGQKFYFKGIAVNARNNKGSAMSNKKVELELRDVNSQLIKTLNLVTNEYGSFSGEIILPNTGLTGNFYLRGKIGKTIGALNFSVEEYKRPKFEAEFKPVTGVFKVNDTIITEGLATAFAGSMITDAKVSYRIVRNAQYPPWYWYRRSYQQTSALEIAHGETITDDKGKFEIKFKAIPDLTAKKEDQPTFSYQVYADVIDVNGETHTAQTVVYVGYHTLNLGVSNAGNLDRTIKTHHFQVSSTNLNGEFVASKGKLKIFKLTPPKDVLRARPWNAPDYKGLSKADFKEKFPHEAYADEHLEEKWVDGKLMYETNFDTEKSKEAIIKGIKKWDIGRYVVRLEAKDAFDQEVKAEQRFTVFDDKAKKVADARFIEIKTDKNQYQPGESVVLSIGSAAKDLHVTLHIEKKFKFVEKRIIKLSDEIKTIKLPVSSTDVGGYSIHYQLVGLNSFLNGSLNVNVPYPTKSLSIETNTFRDKLQPGQNETWSFKIKGTNKDKVAAEVLASMYDASLDQFRGHNWYFNPIQQRYYYGYSRSRAHNSFGLASFNIHYEDRVNVIMPYQNFDRLKWFGLDFNNASWKQRNYVNNLKRDRKTFDKIITGVVKDETGPLPGVSVIIKGTQYGTETDFDGRYSIKVKNEDVLVFSYLGFSTIELNEFKDKKGDVLLETNGMQLDEVVVTGYGSKRRSKGLLYSKIQVESEEVDSGIEDLGKEAGAPIQIRGQASGVEVSKLQAPEQKEAASDLKGVVARKNLQETAFFYPHLQTDAEGNVSFTFTVPESLTKWNLNLLAHSKDMAVAQQRLSAVTQKELMVMPNAPRFFREGDKITFAAKIANLSDKTLNGFTELQLFDALTNAPIDVNYGNVNKQQSFTVDAKGNTNINWKLNISDDVQAVKYRIVAKADEFSDGEENALPVLSNRMLVTETLPMWVRSNQTRTFSLDKLRTTTSTSLKHHNLSLEVTSNPAWYAVQALPYLMEYPYECSEQTFARYYSNALASHIANVNPRIQEVFKQWANSDALLSNLEKNQELKSLIIQETPWVRDAQSETEQKKRIALLFDMNKMNNEFKSALRKLTQMQFSNGGFPWFKGARYPNRYITQHIASGFGHLAKLGVATDDGEVKLIQKAVKFLDDEILDDYTKLLLAAKKIRLKAKTKSAGIKAERAYLAANHLGNFQVQYLYMRSFYKALAMPKSVEPAVTYYTQQAYTYWKDRNLYTKGMIALVGHRNGHASAKAISKSLAENAVVNDELGMYWKENSGGWYWYQSKIETQALMIEVFSEIDKDTKRVDELKVWLLKNKQTNRWKTTKATTEAVYSLLLQGSDWLEVTDFVGVQIGNQKIDPLQLEDSRVEAGTGYFKTSWKGPEIKPEMATVTLTKKDKGVAWGGLYWQYFEDLDKITPAKTPLQLSKKLFLKKNTDAGEVLTGIDQVKLQLGDLVRVRIELKVDRDMEFIHMKDMRAAGFEPVNVLSQYKWQDGFGYYESTKDAATNFFMDYLPKGVYVFEYDLRVNNKGDFSNGITTIQSMYAPEFSSHSEGVRVVVE